MSKTQKPTIAVASKKQRTTKNLKKGQVVIAFRAQPGTGGKKIKK